MPNPYTSKPQGFLEDYSPLSAVASAVQAFGDSYEKAQDRQYKRMEQEAQMQALKTKMQREQDQSAIEAYRAKIQKGPDGQYTDRPESPMEQLEHNEKNFNMGAKRDPNDPTKVIMDPNTPAAISAKNKGLALTQTNEHRDNVDWEKFSEKVNNPAARSAFGRYQQMIDKAGALKTMERTLGMPPGQIAPDNETQDQKIKRYNDANPTDLYEVATAADQLVKNGQATVYGTEHLMPKDIGLAGSTLAQWVANKSVPAGQGAFIDKFMHMADRENEYYNQKRDAGLSKFIAGYEHLKKKDRERWDRILRGEQSPILRPQPQTAVTPPGVLEKKGGGLLSGLLSPIFGSQADATPKPDPQIQAYANEHKLTYEAAQNIIQERLKKQNAQPK